jgi:hypothetical protein
MNFFLTKAVFLFNEKMGRGQFLLIHSHFPKTDVHPYVFYKYLK